MVQVLSGDNVSADRFVRFEAVIIDPETQEIIKRIHLIDLGQNEAVELAVERLNHNKEDR